MRRRAAALLIAALSVVAFAGPSGALPAEADQGQDSDYICIRSKPLLGEGNQFCIRFL